ncbi:MAG: hypothetical protein Q9225_002809 [Loekoesia sp. 1 TL-2023]
MSTLAHLIPTDAHEDPAVIVPGTSGFTISHDDLREQCMSLRLALAQKGVGPATAVSISLPNSFEFIAVFLAITWQRGIAAPLNSAYKEEEVLFYINDIDTTAVIVPKGGYQQKSPAVLAAKKRGAAVIECYTVEGQVKLDWLEMGVLSGSQKEKEVEDAREDDVALVLHTSGTTGRPKAVPLTHKNLTVSAVASFMATLKAGSAVIIPPRLAPSFWKDFEAYKATWYTATPTMHKILLSFHPPEKMPDVRFIRSCSSPLSPQTMESLEASFGAPVLEAYAMTEAAHQITSNPLPPASRYPGSVGLPGGDIKIQILDENGHAVDRGKEGEVCIRSSSVTAGYLYNESANASSFTENGFFRTGDYGKQDENGYLILTGRIKEFINKGGEKVSPVELDNLIAKHAAVADVVVFAIDDDMYGQEVGAAVVLKVGEELSARDLQKWVRSKVAPLKVPKKVCYNSTSKNGHILTMPLDLVPLGDTKDSYRESPKETSCGKNESEQLEAMGRDSIQWMLSRN